MAASTLSAAVVHSWFVCYYYTKAPTLFAMKISGSHIENLGAGTVMGVVIFNHIEWNIKIEQIIEVNFTRFIAP